MDLIKAILTWLVMAAIAAIVLVAICFLLPFVLGLLALVLMVFLVANKALTLRERFRQPWRRR